MRLQREFKQREETPKVDTEKQIRFEYDLSCKLLQDELEQLKTALSAARAEKEEEKRESEGVICSLMEENKALNMNLEKMKAKLTVTDEANSQPDISEKRKSVEAKNVSFEEPKFLDRNEENTVEPLTCRLCGVKIQDTCKRCLTESFQAEIECDDIDGSESASIVDPVVVRLKHGGSAYGSREELNKIAILSPEEDFSNRIPTIDHLSKNNVSSQSSLVVDQLGPESLMSEMGAQYAVLIEKYETLLKQKDTESNEKNASNVEGSPRHRMVAMAASVGIDSVDTLSSMPKRGIGNVIVEDDQATSRSVQTETVFLEADGGLATTPPISSASVVRRRQCRSLIVTGLEQGKDPTDYGFDHSPPEYKTLFKEIFATLRRTVDKESTRPPTPPKVQPETLIDHIPVMQLT